LRYGVYHSSPRNHLLQDKEDTLPGERTSLEALWNQLRVPELGEEELQRKRIRATEQIISNSLELAEKKQAKGGRLQAPVDRIERRQGRKANMMLFLIMMPRLIYQHKSTHNNNHKLDVASRI
jgi:hypothetical protein